MSPSANTGANTGAPANTGGAPEPAADGDRTVQASESQIQTLKLHATTVASEINRYLRSGGTDVYHSAWPSHSFMERALQARSDLRGALVDEVLRRSEGVALPDVPSPDEITALTRRRTEPMVRGLFPRAEQDIVLALVERSVVFLTPANVAEALIEESFDQEAWDLANLYLNSIGAELLGPDAPTIVGISQEATCFVTPRYFDEEAPFADFVVHEVAHIFHNCKRRVAGLRHTRRKEWLLDIQFQKRETFAYSCEAFSRIIERAPRFRARRELAAEFAERFTTSDKRVDPAEVADIVREASTRRNGWKAILARCAPLPRSR